MPDIKLDLLSTRQTLALLSYRSSALGLFESRVASRDAKVAMGTLFSYDQFDGYCNRPIWGELGNCRSSKATWALSISTASLKVVPPQPRQRELKLRRTEGKRPRPWNVLEGKFGLVQD